MWKLGQRGVSKAFTPVYCPRPGYYSNSPVTCIRADASVCGSLSGLVEFCRPLQPQQFVTLDLSNRQIDLA